MSIPTEPTGRNPSENPEATDGLRRTVKVMDRLHAGEIFDTPEHSKEFLDSLSYEEFKKFISHVNGLERGIPAGERDKVSDSVVVSESMLYGNGIEYYPPHRTYRDYLLNMAFDKAKSIPNPELAGLTLGLAINAVHYFADGNGRTSRLVYSLLSRGYDGSEDANAYYSTLLTQQKGRELANINPSESGLDALVRQEMFEKLAAQEGYAKAFDRMPLYVFGGHGDTFVNDESPDTLTVSPDIDENTRRMLFHVLSSPHMDILSIMKAFPPDRIGEYVRTSSDGARTFIVGDEFLPTLTKDEIIDLYTSHEHILVSYVVRLINVADRPDVEQIAAQYRSPQLVWS